METWEKKETGFIREGEREGDMEERVWRDCKGMCTCLDCGCLVEQKVWDRSKSQWPERVRNTFAGLTPPFLME